MSTIELERWTAPASPDDTAALKDWGHAIPLEAQLMANIAAFWMRHAEAPTDIRPRRFPVDAEAISAMVDWAIAQDFAPDDGERIRDDAWH
jgi:hypothetical protein